MVLPVILNLAPHVDHIDTAFLQLSFAFKIERFLADSVTDKEAFKENFDIPLTVEDGESRIVFPHNEFSNYQTLQIAAQNNISICFGVAAITLWEAIREHTGFSNEKLSPEKCARENLASLSYMIRCCFAHGTARPVWSIHRNKYKTKYYVGNKTIDLSLIAKGQTFAYTLIGGYETLWFLRDEARARGLLPPAAI